ncbi:MAG: hypothetical protein Q7R85_00880 [bacterium]|nr:hypothetical protein [bacterium]
MRPQSSLRTILFSALFLISIGAQSSHVFTVFGANINFFMAGLPALLMAVPASVVGFLVIAAVAMLKTIPVLQGASLALLLVAFLVSLGRRFVPLHPALLNPMLSAGGVAGFYALTNRVMFSARAALLTELLTTAFVSLFFTMLIQNFNEKR